MEAIWSGLWQSNWALPKPSPCSWAGFHLKQKNKERRSMLGRLLAQKIQVGLGQAQPIPKGMFGSLYLCLRKSALFWSLKCVCQTLPLIIFHASNLKLRVCLPNTPYCIPI